MIAYPYQDPHPVTDVFASIAGCVVVIQDDEGHFWIPSLGVDTIGDMVPGKGYQMFLSCAVSSFCYPSLPATALGKGPGEVLGSDPRHFEFEATGMAQAVLVTESSIEINQGDEIGVFDGSLCVGAAAFNGEYPVVIAAWEGNEEYELPGFTEGNPITLRLWRSSTEDEEALEVHFAEEPQGCFRGAPVSLASLGHDGLQPPGHDQVGVASIWTSPNPFVNVTMIGYQLPTSAHVSVSVYSVRGEVVRCLVDRHEEAGQYHIEWDGTDEDGRRVSSGIYFCKLNAGRHKAIKPIVFTR
jgi:hypothetical protein